MHDNVTWVRFWSRVLAIKITMICDVIGLFIQFNLIGNIFKPWVNFLSIAPTIAAVQPCSMFVWLNTFFYTIRATKGSACTAEYAGICVFLVHYKIMRGHAEFCAIIVVTTMSSYDCEYSHFLCTCRNNEFFWLVFLVITFVESASAEQFYDFVWDECFWCFCYEDTK